MQVHQSIYSVKTPKIAPGSYGKSKIEYDHLSGWYTLSTSGTNWMQTDRDYTHTRNTMFAHFDLAHGDVLITGLGFGIIATAIAEKEEVTSVTVLEISQDVIDAFLANNVPSEKIKIIQADACTYETDIEYDCLLPDHYELQDYEWRIKDMNRIASTIPHKVFWPWSIEEIFLKDAYPLSKYMVSCRELFDLYSKEMPGKWKSFVSKNFNSHPTLLGIEDYKLIEYLEKTAVYYYDIPNPFKLLLALEEVLNPLPGHK